MRYRICLVATRTLVACSLLSQLSSGAEEGREVLQRLLEEQAKLPQDASVTIRYSVKEHPQASVRGATGTWIVHTGSAENWIVKWDEDRPAGGEISERYGYDGQRLRRDPWGSRPNPGSRDAIALQSHAMTEEQARGTCNTFIDYRFIGWHNGSLHTYRNGGPCLVRKLVEGAKGVSLRHERDRVVVEADVGPPVGLGRFQILLNAEGTRVDAIEFRSDPLGPDGVIEQNTTRIQWRKRLMNGEELTVPKRVTYSQKLGEKLIVSEQWDVDVVFDDVANDFGWAAMDTQSGRRMLVDGHLYHWDGDRLVSGFPPGYSRGVDRGITPTSLSSGLNRPKMVLFVMNLLLLVTGVAVWFGKPLLRRLR